MVHTNGGLNMHFLKKLFSPNLYTLETDNGYTFQHLDDILLERLVIACLESNVHYHVYPEE